MQYKAALCQYFRDSENTAIFSIKSTNMQQNGASNEIINNPNALKPYEF